MPLSTPSQWEKAFSAAGIEATRVEKYVDYLTPLLASGLPVIFDFEHLAQLLGRSKEFLAKAINAPNYFYREFTIPKRSGGVRIISAPYPSLMECQKWIASNILSTVKVNRAAHGFLRKKSIITNANIHLDQEHFLKIDLKDFFPSVSINWVIKVFKDLGYNDQVSFSLASLCCLDGALPQGSPASPNLSNIVCRHLDNRLLSFAKRCRLKYTRYADDIAFSGDKIAKKHIDYVTAIISDCGFSVNPEKTKLQQRRGRRILTGLSISKPKVEVPKDFRRKLQQEMYFIRKYGLRAHMVERKIRTPNYRAVLIGKLNFWLSVEKDNAFVKSSIDYLRGDDEIETSNI